jgi:hypothetical protein
MFLTLSDDDILEGSEQDAEDGVNGKQHKEEASAGLIHLHRAIRLVDAVVGVVNEHSEQD